MRKLNDMDEYNIKIHKIENLTKDIKLFRTDKPKGFEFISGQSVMLSINKKEWKDKRRAFTMSSINRDDYIEFTIKIYLENKGVTAEMDKLKEGDELIMGKPFGNMIFRNKGLFIAGGCGIAPFISIFRELYKDGKIKDNVFIFSNKKEEDIIYKDELKKMLGKDCHFVLTREKKEGYEFGRIDQSIINKVIKEKKEFYVCGPKDMVKEIYKSIEIVKNDGGDIHVNEVINSCAKFN